MVSDQGTGLKKFTEFPPHKKFLRSQYFSKEVNLPPLLDSPGNFGIDLGEPLARQYYEGIELVELHLVYRLDDVGAGERLSVGLLRDVVGAGGRVEDEHGGRLRDGRVRLLRHFARGRHGVGHDALHDGRRQIQVLRVLGHFAGISDKWLEVTVKICQNFVFRRKSANFEMLRVL